MASRFVCVYGLCLYRNLKSKNRISIMAWFRRKNEIDDAINAGQLDRAMELTRRLGESKAAREHRRQLTEALILRTNSAAETEDFPFAWQTLAHAASFADPRQQTLVSQTTRQLQSQTVNSADAVLQAGQVQQAAGLVKLLAERDLSNQKSKQIGSVADLLKSVDQLTLVGKLDESIEHLESAQGLYPNLPGLQERLAEHQRQKQQLDSLTQSLQSAALSCKWNEVGQLCDQILEIAPQHEIAVGAKRHAMQRVKRRTSVGSRLTNVPQSPKPDDDLVIKPKSSGGGSASSTNSANVKDTAAIDSEAPASSASSDKVDSALEVEQDFSLAPLASSFLIWVDGVGGYLVCTKQINFIGQATEGSTVSIPLQADVRQRHARIETIAGQHLIQPLGPVAVAGRQVPVDESIAIKSGQLISLGDKVELSYRQEHPLSKSARLDFVSRHRTLPWSDGVILAGQSIILGPNPNNHVFCPGWKADLILFRRNDQWFAKSKIGFCVDDQALANEEEIRFDSRLYGDSFSLKLEPVFLDG